MYSEFFRAHSRELMEITIAGGVLLGALFLGVLVWLFLERSQRFEELARQPIEEQERSVRS
ncbi:MAG TPA: CcoQ/FixQ family Cbb3-type cytochrome c oxidase assembly chaperone [Myxococcaceae bacterium]|nr:CcoQ/FixQ family Cbb3-type cytochrome c oxidase assembly chaperone [Myxococcaceae bacterium]